MRLTVNQFLQVPWFESRYFHIMKIDFKILLIILLAVVISLNFYRMKTADPHQIIEQRCDTIVLVDTIIRDGETIYRDSIKPQFIFFTKNIDTIKVVNDYFKQFIYYDTLKMKTGYVAITDTITNNKLKTRKYEYSINAIQPQEEKKLKLYYGFDSNLGGSTFSLAPAVVLKPSSNILYKINVGIISNTKLQPYVGFGCYYSF